MSSEMREYDSLVREKMREKKITPPPSVWENIQKKRSFGHKVAVKIATNWRTFGTLVLLSLIGSGSLLLSETANIEDSNSYFISNASRETSDIKIEQTPKKIEFAKQHSSFNILEKRAVNSSEPKESTNTPDFSMVASNYGLGFGKPLNEDARISALIEQIDNWESGKSATAIRFNHLDYVKELGVQANIIVKTAAVPKEDFEYVIPEPKIKSFWDRSSLILSLTPQTINKTITPGHNLSTREILKRKESEKSRMAFSLGANFRYELKNHQFIESGLMYTSIYEEIHLSGEKQFSNNYNFIEIPLLFGYQDREAKWGWFVKGGLGVQILNTYDGYIFKQENLVNKPDPTVDADAPLYRMSASSAINGIINPDHQLNNKQIRDEVYDLSTDENPYKTAGVINLHLAAGLMYYCGEKTSIFASPYYRRNINSISKSDAMFREHISFMGISFGTQVKF